MGKDLMKCRGKFQISSQLIREGSEIVQNVFSKVIPIRAEMMFHTNSIEYDCLSYEFEEIEPCVDTPIYEILIAGDEIKFRLIKPYERKGFTYAEAKAALKNIKDNYDPEAVVKALREKGVLI